MAEAATRNAVSVSRLTDADRERLKSYLEKLTEQAPDLARKRLMVRVSGYGDVASYMRARPGAKPLVDFLGKDSFELFGGLLALGFQAYNDHQRDDLNGAQRVGRVGIALLGATVPPLGLVMLGASIAFPEQYDKITADAFTDRNPLVRGIADVIVAVGGKPFQNWSVRPSVIDFF